MSDVAVSRFQHASDITYTTIRTSINKHSYSTHFSTPPREYVVATKKNHEKAANFGMIKKRVLFTGVTTARRPQPTTRLCARVVLLYTCNYVYGTTLILLL